MHGAWPDLQRSWSCPVSTTGGPLEATSWMQGLVYYFCCTPAAHLWPVRNFRSTPCDLQPAVLWYGVKSRPNAFAGGSQSLHVFQAQVPQCACE